MDEEDDDQWGYCKLLANGHEVLQYAHGDPNGTAGHKAARSDCWLNHRENTAPENVHTMYAVDLAGYTCYALGAKKGKKGKVYVQFLINGNWTSKIQWFVTANKGETKRKRFDALEGPVTRVRVFVEDGTDAWGYWRITANGRDICRDPNGELGSRRGPSE